MGYDAKISFNESVNRKKVEDFLIFLGYSRHNKDIYYHYNEEDFKSLCYVHAYFDDDKNNLILRLRTLMHCSEYDLSFMNKTLKELKRYFNCIFESDEGKNRYFQHNNIIVKAEAGCYKAYSNLFNEFSTLNLFLMILDKDKSWPINEDLNDIIGRLNNPMYTIRAMALPYLVTIIEEYFRNTFTAILMYSDRKEIIYKSNRINYYECTKVSDKEMSIDEAVSRTLSFQNMNKIIANFKDLEPNLDIYGALSKPYRRRKETLFFTLDRILNKRHQFIHSNIVDIFYENKDLKKDIASVEVALEKTYACIVDYFDWTYYH